MPLSTLGFSCRLPIYVQVQGSPIQDGFVSFPGNAVAVDPNGKQGMYYDRAFSRWLPVARTSVSPDGAHYAYAEIGQQTGEFFVHVMDVATGIDHSFRELASAAGISAQPVVFDYSADGIYLVEAFEVVWSGLWLVDPKTGSIHQVSDISTPRLSAGSGVFWYGTVNPADPNPFSTRSSGGVYPDELDRLDLRSGSRTTWLYRPGMGIDFLGLDVLGRPLIRLVAPGKDQNIAGQDFFDHSASELLIALNSTSQRSIQKGEIVETLGGPVADSHGVWFGSPHGIYLYSDANGLQKVSNQPGNPANGCF